MQITLLQGLLLAAVVFICAFDGCMEVFMWFRPLIVSFLVGIVLGDIPTGLAAGSVAELSYIGLLTVGGTVPLDPLFAGLMTTVISHVSGQSAQAALGLSLPFAVMAQGIGIFCYTTFAGFLRPLDRAAEKADTKKFTTIVIGASLLRSFFMAVLAFVTAYVLQRQLSDFISIFPEKLIHGFEVAGNLMPAVGLALLLVVTLKKQNFAYLFIGFILVIITNAQNILPVAILASAIAYIGYINEEPKGGEEDGI